NCVAAKFKGGDAWGSACNCARSSWAASFLSCNLAAVISAAYNSPTSCGITVTCNIGRAFSCHVNSAVEVQDRSLPLPFCKREGSLAICVRPGETLTVPIENRRHPVQMLPAFAISKFSSFAVCIHSADSITAPARRIATSDSGKLRGQIDAAFGD